MSAGMISAPALRQTQRYEKIARLGLPKYSIGEEICNALSHGVGAVLGVVQLVLLLLFCQKDALTVVSVSIYGGSMILLYLISTLYHSLGINKAKAVFRILDHCTIYLLIAGTYTPMTLLTMPGLVGALLLAFVWSMAVLGIVLNAVNMKRFKVFSMVCYLGMGWSVVFVLPTLLAALNQIEFVFLLLGGIFYTVGAVFYGFGRKHAYIHFVWHLFVLAGSVSQFFVVFSVAVK
jgi:hemolysin III